MKLSAKLQNQLKMTATKILGCMVLVLVTLATVKLVGFSVPENKKDVQETRGMNQIIALGSNMSVAEDGAIICDSIVEGVRDSDLTDGTYTFRITGKTTDGIVEQKDYKVELINYYDDVTYTSNTSLGDASKEYKMLVVKYHKNLTINSGVTITATTVSNLTYKKGMYLCVMGTLENNGEISMTKRGTYNCAGENVYLWKNTDDTFEYVPANGASGVSNNTVGKNGVGRQTGGGAGGKVETVYGGTGGASSGGTSYSGGSGGGGTTRASAGNAAGNGGAGGAGAYWSGYTGGGGAGNPGGGGSYSGETGTGGLLIIYANEMINKNNITAVGAKGGNGYQPGGSSGGGSINIFYNTMKAKGKYNVDGGPIGQNVPASGYSGSKGLQGGTGTVTLNRLQPKMNYPEKTIEVNVGDNYIIDTSLIKYINQNLKQGSGVTLGPVEYEMLDTSIATVNSSGVITGVKDGKTKILLLMLFASFFYVLKFIIHTGKILL